MRPTAARPFADRNHAQCRGCGQIVRRDWRVCAHCGVSSPVPLSGGQRLAMVGLLVTLAGAAWWATGETGAIDQVTNGAQSLFRSAAEIEGQGGALAPSTSSEPVTGSRFAGGPAGGLPAAGSGTTGATSVGGGKRGTTRSSTAAAVLFRRDADAAGSSPTADSMEGGSTGRGDGDRDPPDGDARERGDLRRRPASTSSDSGTSGRPTAGMGDTLASAMRRAAAAILGGQGRDGGRSPALPAPLIP
jgi:hypothetical protein